MQVSLAREVAYDAFIAVMEHKQRPEDVLEQMYAKHGKDLKRLDRNFIKELLYGSLRWYSKIYWILQNTSKRDLATTTPEIRAALVVGTYQIFYMDRVPDRAAVNESVEYLRKKGQTSATSFGNGILRQIARRAAYFAKPDKEKTPEEYLSLQYAHPRWIVDRWYHQVKSERLEKILSENNQPPPYSIRINTLKVPTEKIGELQDELLRKERTHSERRNLRTALRLKDAPQLDEGSLFQQGWYTIQDESSQLIAMLVHPQPGDHILDACAGPGGKLSHVYELAQGKAQIFAIDRSKTQLQKAVESMARLGHTQGMQYLQADFLEFTTEQLFDRILLDAPCTGLGVLRRHPEGKWHKDPSSLRTLAEKQRGLILKALSHLKVGGRLTYSVCSFEPEESLDHLHWLKNTYPEQIEILSPVSVLPDYFKKYVTRDNILTIYSGNQDEMDGFAAFMVQLKSALQPRA